MVISRAITVGREYGSEGREIGEKLVQRLGIPFHDKELIAMIAKEGNIKTSVLETNDEMDPDLDNYLPQQVSPDHQTAMIRRIHAAQAIVIHSLNDGGLCVTAGCCADTIPPDAISIFIFADTGSRISRIISLNPGFTREETKASIPAVNKRCEAYDEYYFTTQQGDVNMYDICLNSGLAGMEGCLEAALTYIKYVK